MKPTRLAAPALGITLLLTGALKTIDALAAIKAAAAYDLLPAWGAFAVGALLPALEVVLGSALLLGSYRRTAAIMTGVLAALFAVANTSAMTRGLLVDCGCFGGAFGTAPGVSLVVDVALLVLAVLVAKSG